MKEVFIICEAIGRDVLASAIGVTRQSISNAISDNAFPASWFLVVKKLCAARKIRCPLRLFKFKATGAMQNYPQPANHEQKKGAAA
jgi:hypothetical protein